MDAKIKEILLNKVIKIAQNTSDPANREFKRGKFLGSEGVGFQLVDEHLDAFEGLIKYILNHKNWSSKFSEKYIHDILRDLIIKLLNDGDGRNAKEYIDEFVEELDTHNVSFTTYIPLIGLRLEHDEQEFGNILLKTIKTEDITELRNSLKAILLTTKNFHKDEIQADEAARACLSEIKEGMVCAVQTINAEEIRAMERSMQDVRRALDVFKFCTPYFYHDNQRVIVGIMGEAIPGKRVMPMISTDSTKFTIDQESTGPFIAFELTNESLKKMEDIGALEFLHLLKKDENDLTNFEKTLLRGLHWFASAQTQEEVENRFLNLIICIETYLTPKDGNPIQTAIAEGAAIILSNELEQRKKIKRKVQNLYRKRSAVSHGGRKSILDSDLNELIIIAGTLTIILVKKISEFQSQKELLHWIEDQKLG